MSIKYQFSFICAFVICFFSFPLIIISTHVEAYPLKWWTNSHSDSFLMNKSIDFSNIGSGPIQIGAIIHYGHEYSIRKKTWANTTIENGRNSQQSIYVSIVPYVSSNKQIYYLAPHVLNYERPTILNYRAIIETQYNNYIEGNPSYYPTAAFVFNTREERDSIFENLNNLLISNKKLYWVKPFSINRSQCTESDMRGFLKKIFKKKQADFFKLCQEEINCSIVLYGYTNINKPQGLTYRFKPPNRTLKNCSYSIHTKLFSIQFPGDLKFFLEGKVAERNSNRLSDYINIPHCSVRDNFTCISTNPNLISSIEIDGFTEISLYLRNNIDQIRILRNQLSLAIPVNQHSIAFQLYGTNDESIDNEETAQVNTNRDNVVKWPAPWGNPQNINNNQCRKIDNFRIANIALNTSLHFGSGWEPITINNDDHNNESPINITDKLQLKQPLQSDRLIYISNNTNDIINPNICQKLPQYEIKEMYLAVNRTIINNDNTMKNFTRNLMEYNWPITKPLPKFVKLLLVQREPIALHYKKTISQVFSIEEINEVVLNESDIVINDLKLSVRNSKIEFSNDYELHTCKTEQQCKDDNHNQFQCYWNQDEIARLKLKPCTWAKIVYKNHRISRCIQLNEIFESDPPKLILNFPMLPCRGKERILLISASNELTPYSQSIKDCILNKIDELKQNRNQLSYKFRILYIDPKRNKTTLAHCTDIPIIPLSGDNSFKSKISKLKFSATNLNELDNLMLLEDSDFPLSDLDSIFYIAASINESMIEYNHRGKIEEFKKHRIKLNIISEDCNSWLNDAEADSCIDLTETANQEMLNDFFREVN